MSIANQKSSTEADSNAVLKFLQLLMQVHKQLHEMARQLRSCSEVKNATVYPFLPGDMTQHHWDEEQRRSAIGSEFGVSAELHDGAMVDWWLEVWCEESKWHIAASVLKSDRDEEGCHKVAEFDEQQDVLTLEAALKRLSEAVTWLVANRDALITKRPELA